MTGLTLRASVPALMGRTSLDQLFDSFFTNPVPQIKQHRVTLLLTSIKMKKEIRLSKWRLQVSQKRI